MSLDSKLLIGQLHLYSLPLDFASERAWPSDVLLDARNITQPRSPAYARISQSPSFKGTVLFMHPSDEQQSN